MAVALAVLLVAPLPGAASTPLPRTLPIRAAGTSAQHIQHVVIIVLENEGSKFVWLHGPYERYLGVTYGKASSFYAACHPSAPNYLAMISAATLQCGSDAWNNYTATTLGDLIDGANGSWHAYAENLPKHACQSPGTTTAGPFAVRHVPFLYFANVTGNQTYCHQHVLTSGAFNSSVAKGALGNLSFYTPNLCDDGHDGCGGNTTGAQMTRQADAWLRDFLGPIMNHTGRYTSSAERQMVNHTAFIVTWDEGLGSNAGYNVSGVTRGDNYAYCAHNGAKGDAVCGGPIYFVIVSPYSLNTRMTVADSDYGIAATVEWLFQLPHLRNRGHYDAMSAFPPAKSLFTFSQN